MKFTRSPLGADTPAQTPAVKAPAAVVEPRCGGCVYFRSRLDPNNPFDGFCHALPPAPVSTGFRWAKTASNEFSCSLFKKRG